MIFSTDGKKKRLSGDLTLSHQGMVISTFREKLEALLAVCRANFRTFDADLITRAFDFSVQSHKGHRRKSGEPYFTHPFATAMILAQEIPLDDISIASALLHDVIEDNEDITYDNIMKEFGPNIADIVDGATKISNILQSREVTKAENYRKLMLSMVNDIRVILVKFADRLHNMRTLEFVNKEKQMRISKETLEIYAPLAHRFGLGSLKWELEDLSFKYMHEQEYRQLKDQIMLKRREREDYIAKFIKPISAALDKMNIKHEISGRPKHLYSIYKKMVDRNKTIDEIYDLFAIRIILDTDEEKDCYLAYAIVCELYTPIPERYKNYIALPKQNGYKSIHTTVLGIDGKMVEVQIRTREMHEIADKGIAAHWAYKESIQTKQSAFENWIRWVREILEIPQTPNDEEGAIQLIDDFKRTLYQEEIVVFTPKGDLIVLPHDATAVDFAFEIHSEVGLHCIGAKVNGRIVPLNRKLRSGDQVEIITSRNQHLSPDWEQCVITHKARAAIRKFVNERAKMMYKKGKEIWERKTKKLKLSPTDEQLSKVAAQLRLQNITKMFIALGNDEIGVEDILTIFNATEEERESEPLPVLDQHDVFEKFAELARKEKGILIEGRSEDIQYSFAQCCNPLPGDEVIGFVTQGRGIKIHRRNCSNIQRLMRDKETTDSGMRDRLVEISWPANTVSEYLGGIRLEGDDRPGVLNEIAMAISGYHNTNIKSVNIETKNAMFNGSVLVSVRDLHHLQGVIERVKKVKGVTIAERYIEVS